MLTVVQMLHRVKTFRSCTLYELSLNQHITPEYGLSPRPKYVKPDPATQSDTAAQQPLPALAAILVES